ncbi:alcohol dehydrogenase [Hyphodiscus hymeniophilus]|uniref:Alcohol dehydrogenase n=1 Tax=Hyphodiscus hymeniophilus TaxID=353542 RepID=A0A9P6VLE5_9HELO|nr:alcohol dehydrogenase [Hyphodiscus hymeniophilus]
MSSEYDFIVVGAGPSGCALATRLAQSKSKPSVLLVEAGGQNKDASYLVPADRFTLAFKEADMNWSYKTEPQTQLKGQQIDYSRGKGLGGSTAINFSCWVIGPSDDYDEWADKIGDEAWSWKEVKKRLRKVESYHIEVPEGHKFIRPKVEDHGTSGSLHLSYASTFEKGLEDVWIAAEEVGLGVNPDVNSGNPIGMGMGAACMYQGARTTAASYLEDAPSNLTVAVNSPVAKVILSAKTAKGIRTIDGKEYFAEKDVILSAGALDSPKLLMLSGIGPSDELQRHGIPLVHELPDVGKHLQDHCFATATLLQKPGTNDRMTFETDEKAVSEARDQHTKDKTGLMAELYCSTPMGWFKNEKVVESAEYKALDKHTQAHILKPTVPIFEIATHTPPLYTGDYELKPTDCYLTALGFVMNPQSEGEVTLNSASPSDAPKVDPKLLSHPYDRRVMIEAMRSMMDYLEAPVFKKNTVRMIGCPKSRSDEDIWDHCSGNLFSSWHMCSTVRMGKKDQKDACVDTDFKSTAYLVGETAAEKIIVEYGLN